MLEYVQNSRKTAAVDMATKEIDKCVNNVRLDPEIRGKYMTFGDKLDRTFIEAQKKLIIKLTCSKMLRGMSVKEIAEDLETDESEIAEICEAAAKYAPEYNPDDIYTELLNGSGLVTRK